MADTFGSIFCVCEILCSSLLESQKLSLVLVNCIYFMKRRNCDKQLFLARFPIALSLYTVVYSSLSFFLSFILSFFLSFFLSFRAIDTNGEKEISKTSKYFRARQTNFATTTNTLFFFFFRRPCRSYCSSKIIYVSTYLAAVSNKRLS